MFHDAMVKLGALSNGSNVLIDSGCEVTIVVSSGFSCVNILEMDVEGASYRQIPGSDSMTKMCDFTVGLAANGIAEYCAIELKSGEPYLVDAAQQLREGLRAIARYGVDGNRNMALRAILVVGVMSPRLIRIALSPEGRLSILGREIQIELAGLRWFTSVLNCQRYENACSVLTDVDGARD